MCLWRLVACDNLYEMPELRDLIWWKRMRLMMIKNSGIWHFNANIASIIEYGEDMLLWLFYYGYYILIFNSHLNVIKNIQISE